MIQSNSIKKTISLVVLTTGLVLSLGCSDDADDTPDPPEQFAFVAQDGGDDHDSQCPGDSGDSADGCGAAPMSMCTVVRGAEVMAFVEIDVREEHENECGDRPFRFDHAVNDITVTGIIAGNNNFASADEVYTWASTNVEAGGTYILKARELDGRWWSRGSLEIESDGVEAAGSSGIYEEIPTTTGEFSNEVDAHWDNYQMACDTDEPRMLSYDSFYDSIYGQDMACADDGNGDSPNTGSVDNQGPDGPPANNQQDPDGSSGNNNDG